MTSARAARALIGAESGAGQTEGQQSEASYSSPGQTHPAPDEGQREYGHDGAQPEGRGQDSNKARVGSKLSR